MIGFIHLCSFWSLLSICLTFTLIDPKLSISGNLPYQAHSFNDLNYFKSLLRRSVNKFKIDVSMANKPSCQQQSTWSSVNRTCQLNQQFAEEICCLGLRGDASSSPNLLFPFNTTQQLINVLDHYLAAQKELTIFLAINFQYQFSSADAFTEQFLDKIVNLTQFYAPYFNVVTGSDDFILEFDRMCHNKGAECTQRRQRISNSSIFLQSYAAHPYDIRDYKQRYRNFNVIFTQISTYSLQQTLDRLCTQGFPTWINKFPQYPLIFWQPSNQMQIQQVLSKLLSAQCIEKHNRSIKGIALASNIDPEMFQMYTKRITYDNNIPQQARFDINIQKMWVEGSNFMVDRIFIPQMNDQVLIAAWSNIKQTASVVTLYKKTADSIVELYVQKQFVGLTVKQVMGIGDRIIMLTEDQYKRRTLSLISQKLQLIRSQVLDCVCITTDSNIIYAMSIDSAPGILILTKFNSDLEISQKVQMRFNQYNTAQIKSFQVYKEQQELCLLIVGDNGFQSWISVYYLSKSTHFSRFLTYGSNPTIKINHNNGHLLLKVQNSMCQSAILANNNDMNKCLFFRQNRFNSLQNVKGIVSVGQVNFQNLLAFIKDSTQDPLNSCTQNLSLNKVLTGGHTSIVGIWNYIVAATDYVAIEDTDLMLALFCGGANYQSDDSIKNGSLIVAYQSKQPITNW